MDKLASLTPMAKRIIVDKATEYPHTGMYNQVASRGTYLCRRCGLALFRGSSQFLSGCGWPSFDDSLLNKVEEKLDADGRRQEILCKRCHGHLGHVFRGEHLTSKNLRHCVNSASIDFVENVEVLDSEEAIFAGGCFWGVEYLFKQFPGVLKTEVGYSGGVIEEPTYEQICQGNSGHYEAIRVLYDPAITNDEEITQYFFEAHDPTQASGQGPDIGQQYQSVIFYYNEEQLTNAKTLIQILKEKGYAVVTQLKPVQTFWPAETYHQDYYGKTGKMPYCHQRIKRFNT